jgi:D-alanyl-D-alanine carboxypeptidase
LGFAIGKAGKLDFVGHSGGFPGFITISSMCQARKLIIVVLTSAIDVPASDLSTGIAGLLFYCSKMEAKLRTGLDVDTAWLDDISGFYDNRWGVQLLQRVGDQMVSMMPHLMMPAEAISLSEKVDENSFRWVEGVHNGPFGETVTVEQADGRWQLRHGESISERFEFEY